MLDILVINDVAFPVPEGGFTVALEDVVNEYTSETGETTVEIIRQDVATIDVSYNGLTESQKNTLLAALSTVSEATFDKKGETVTVQARVSGISSKKVFYRNDVSVWSLSFKLEEL